MLWNKILQCHCKPLEEPLAEEEIMKDEVDPPDSVNQFFKILYAGPWWFIITKRKTCEFRISGRCLSMFWWQTLTG